MYNWLEEMLTYFVIETYFVLIKRYCNSIIQCHGFTILSGYEIYIDDIFSQRLLHLQGIYIYNFFINRSRHCWFTCMCIKHAYARNFSFHLIASLFLAYTYSQSLVLHIICNISNSLLFLIIYFSNHIIPRVSERVLYQIQFKILCSNIKNDWTHGYTNYNHVHVS